VSKKFVEIFTDGGCRGNPGPGGWGAVLRFERQERTLSGYEANTTNNRMEMTAAIEALQALKQPCQVHLTTDSNYLKEGITKWIYGWKRNGWQTAAKEPVKNVDLWQKLDQLIIIHDVQWLWIKGHSGHRENEMADSLSQEAIKKFLATAHQK
jgi:ribonuclease HI